MSALFVGWNVAFFVSGGLIATRALPSCHPRYSTLASRYPTGNIQPTAGLLEYRDCCRSIFELARRPVQQGGVSAPAEGQFWSHDTVGAAVLMLHALQRTEFFALVLCAPLLGPQPNFLTPSFPTPRHILRTHDSPTEGRHAEWEKKRLTVMSAWLG